MVISISKKLWELSFTDQGMYRTIKKILSWVEDGKHKLIFEKGIDTDQIISNQRYINYSETLKAIITNSFYSEDEEKIVRITYTDQLSSSEKNIFYDGLLLVETTKDKELHYIDVSKVDTYLGRLLYIIVENTVSDKDFVQSVYKYFKGRPLSTETEVQFLHGGGNTISNVASENSEHPVRMICIIDSDKKYPLHPGSNKVKNLLPLCEKRNLQLITLSKREIENYIPPEALKQWLSKEKREAETEHPYFNFNIEQRSFFDMKYGLKEIDLKKKEIMSIYQGYNPDHIQKGFGKTVWKAFREISSGSENYFKDSEFELKNMVQKIDSLL